MMILLSVVLLLFYSCSVTHVKNEITENVALKLCFIGDTGKNSEGQKLAAEGLKTEKCDEIFHVGDIIYPDGLKSTKDKNFKKKFLDHYQGLTITDHHPRINLVMGNHDYNGNIQVWKELSNQYTFINFPDNFYLLKNEQYCIAALDTNIETKFLRRYLVLEQFLWLESLKEELKKCPLKIAFAHHPLKSSGEVHKDAKGLLADFLNGEIAGKFDIFIAGHEHILSNEGVYKGTSLFISGAAGTPFPGNLPGYLTVEFPSVDSKFVTIRLKNIGPDGKVRAQSIGRSF